MSHDPGSRVLILGGTSEARSLAAALDAASVAVVSSLAGRVASPALPAGQVTTGGFGGPDGLARWLSEHQVAAVVDATHPFAERISTSAEAACTATGVPLLRLERPAWTEQLGDRWHWADDVPSATRLVAQARPGSRVLLTIGRQGVSAFAGVESAWFLIRCIEPPGPPLPPHHELLLERGPYAVASELALLDRHRIDLIVTKASGGAATEAKLEAARRRGVPVIMVRRPARPAVPSVAEVSAAVHWVASVLGMETATVTGLGVESVMATAPRRHSGQEIP